MKKSRQSTQATRPGSKLSLRIAGIFALLAAGIVLFLQIRSRDGGPAESGTPQPQTPPAQLPQQPHSALPAPANPAVAAPTNANGLTEKEQMICDIISSGRPTDQMVDDLLALLPECAAAEQKLAVSHLADLVNQEQAGQLIPLLGNPKIDVPIKEQIFTAIYDREPHEAAELLIQVIEVGNSKFVAEAEKTLGILLSADHGTDAAAWRAELRAQKMRQAAE